MIFNIERDCHTSFHCVRKDVDKIKLFSQGAIQIEKFELRRGDLIIVRLPDCFHSIHKDVAIIFIIHHS